MGGKRRRRRSWNLSLGFLFRLPDDVWMVDLDSTKLTCSGASADEIPMLPEPEGTMLKNHLKQVKLISL